MIPEDCKKFDACSAPICPFDDHWRDRPHLQGERVCIYLTEYAKTPTRPNLEQVLPSEAFELVALAHKEIFTTVGLSPVRTTLKKAKLTGSKMFGHFLKIRKSR